MNSKADSINLLFCISPKDLGMFVCSLKSVLLHGGYSRYDVYILHSCFDDGMMAALRHDFKESFTFHFIQVDGERLENFPMDDRYPQETYYRFLAPFLLPQDLERILYLDSDTITINPLHELYGTPFDGNAVVGCTHTREFLTKINQARQQSGKTLLRLNPGVLLLNLPYLREHFSQTDVVNCATKKKTNFVSPDQFILTALCGNNVKLADTLRFNLSEQVLHTYNAEHKHHPIDLPWIREYSVILHYCGYPKPGNANYTGVLAPFYEELLISKSNKPA